MSHYSYNYYNLGSRVPCRGPAVMGDIQRPAELLALADATNCNQCGHRGYPANYDPNTSNAQYYARRHNDGLNIGWADGHVKWMGWKTLYGKSQYWYR